MQISGAGTLPVGDAELERDELANKIGPKAFHRSTTASSLAHQPATLRQHRLVLGAVLEVVACVVISSFPASVPRIDGYIPAILTIVFIADLLTAVLLLNQESVLESRALLVLANGYFFLFDPDRHSRWNTACLALIKTI
jgi:hypothetical protein